MNTTTVTTMNIDTITPESASRQMDTWLRALVPTDGTERQFGNVAIWIDIEGPWKGQLAYSIPTDQWDRAAFNADLVAALTASKGAS